jgi:hypothetical protein
VRAEWKVGVSASNISLIRRRRRRRIGREGGGEAAVYEIDEYVGFVYVQYAGVGRGTARFFVEVPLR